MLIKSRAGRQYSAAMDSVKPRIEEKRSQGSEDWTAVAREVEATIQSWAQREEAKTQE